MRQIKLSPTTAGLLLINILVDVIGRVGRRRSGGREKRLCTQCAGCHRRTPGVNKIGPSLAGVVGSKSGTVPGYDFSAAMKNANITWDDATLDKFLANPAGFVHGTKMFVNLPNETDRQNVIAYLSTLKK